MTPEGIIDHRTKLGGLLVGSILIAGATSLPELAIRAKVTSQGTPGESGVQ